MKEKETPLGFDLGSSHVDLLEQLGGSEVLKLLEVGDKPKALRHLGYLIEEVKTRVQREKEGRDKKIQDLNDQISMYEKIAVDTTGQYTKT